jgi:hypothetical protein
MDAASQIPGPCKPQFLNMHEGIWLRKMQANNRAAAPSKVLPNACMSQETERKRYF